jgi:glycosyltransferase involved in cell wall biosynthesis
MRILSVLHRFLPRYAAGTEVYAGELNRELARRGHQVALFTGDPAAVAPYAYTWEDLPVLAVPWRSGRPASPVATFLAGFGNPAVERRFGEHCAAYKPDLVHVHHLLGLSPALPAIARRYGARVVVTLHDYWFRCSNTWLLRYDEQLCPGPGLGFHCGGCALHRLGRQPNAMLMAPAAPLFVARTLRLRQALRQADALIAPSDLVARVFAADAALRGKLHTIPHGVSPLAPLAGVQRPPARDGVRYGYVGSLIRAKGAHVIVEAFNGLPAGQDELHLYGDQTTDLAYTAAVRGLVARPGVHFHGRVEHQQVLAALAGLDVLLVPSLWQETFAVNVDEAQALGVPVVVSSITAAVERIQPEGNGLQSPPGDVAAWRACMLRLRDEPGLLDRLRGAARHPKSAAAHALEIEGLYQRVVAGSP